MRAQGRAQARRSILPRASFERWPRCRRRRFDPVMGRVGFTPLDAPLRAYELDVLGAAEKYATRRWSFCPLVVESEDGRLIG